jgi:hypothetical protein
VLNIGLWHKPCPKGDVRFSQINRLKKFWQLLRHKLKVVTWYGLPTQGYENGNPRERFRYDSSLETAKFVIIGDIDQRWTFGEPNVNTLIENLQTQGWHVAWKGKHYLILANPRVNP